MPNLTFTPEQLESNFKVVDEGLYQLELVGFGQKLSSKKDSINYNPQFEIVGTLDGSTTPTKDDGSPILLKYAFNGNSKIPSFLQDMVHALGLPMDGDEVHGLSIPGIFDGAQNEPDDLSQCQPEKWEYKGPLLHRRCVAYLVKSNYNNQDNNKIKYFQCALSDCVQKFPKIKHSMDMLRGSK